MQVFSGQIPNVLWWGKLHGIMAWGRQRLFKSPSEEGSERTPTHRSLGDCDIKLSLRHWPFLLFHFVCGVLMVYMCVCMFLHVCGFSCMCVHMHSVAERSYVGSQPRSSPPPHSLKLLNQIHPLTVRPASLTSTPKWVSRGSALRCIHFTIEPSPQPLRHQLCMR